MQKIARCSTNLTTTRRRMTISSNGDSQPVILSREIMRLLYGFRITYSFIQFIDYRKSKRQNSASFTAFPFL